MKTIEKEKLIYGYIKSSANGCSPTELGMNIFKKDYGQASGYVNLALKNMIKKGVIVCTSGIYKISSLQMQTKEN